ncbi:unnamed protein product [Adineta ricciae]|uniref:Uncharacterized protein n=1 Tax=Adineta ricciae TaxID=249248 RepID=A0A815A9B9_ADIRI|nr:unnamed protein product [Adineta ricciae]CAF1254024.1 unnamed protein product [Adineta ricciae]
MSLDTSAVSGHLAQRNVFSATIVNKTSHQIHCFVEYHTKSGSDNEVADFDVAANDEYKCEEKVHSMSTHNTGQSPQSHIFPKVIHSIKVCKADGSTLTAKAPFDNVPHKDVRNWKFVVENNQIRSEKN